MKKSEKVYLAFDLGAGSGLACLGFLDDRRLKLEKINRFTNAPAKLDNTLHWNFISLWANVVESMRICARKGHNRITSIGVDTWGVDFGLLGADGRLLGNPICYRDNLTDGIERIIIKAIGTEELFRLTGIAPSRVTTLSQLYALKRSLGADRLKLAKTLLMMPDLFRYFLCGHKAVELTVAGSSQLLNIRTARWCSKIFAKTGIPLRIMPEIVKPATVVGKLRADLSAETGLNRASVVAVAGHDTLSAAGAAPFVDEDCAFISCGTWSVVGVINDSPVTTAKAIGCGFVNELGLDSVLFAKNMMGLYLFENMRRSLSKRCVHVTYAEMTREASQAKPFRCFLNINSPLFFVTDDPMAKVNEFLCQTGQKPLRSRGAIIRVLFEALAFSFRAAVHDIEKLTGRNLKRTCLVGGGARNRVLCQMVADATGLEVIAGPAEASAAGNVAMQALAIGQLKRAVDIREVIRNSFKLRRYKPRFTAQWDKSFDAYNKIVKKTLDVGNIIDS